MAVTILGSGTCVPSLKRSACSVLIETGDQKFVCDSGPGTMRRLLEAGTTIFDISHLLYSHFHPDHTGELVPLIFATKYPDAERRKTPLRIFAGKGFSEFFDRLGRAYGEWISLPPDMLEMHEFDTAGPDRLETGGVLVETLPMAHRPESVAFRVTGPAGRSVVYSGDTDVCENLAVLSMGADLLICESAMPDAAKVPGHLTPSLAGEIAARSGVGKLVLTHFYPECDNADIAAECRKTYGGEIVLAEDLMRIELG
jgi:ribonuclease BN (tRNA processing enzyme)